MTVTDNILHTTTTSNYTPNDLNQYTNISVNSSNQSVLWDNNFNLSGYNGWTYTYDAENNLVSVLGNGHSATFTYDALGRCVKRVLDGITTVFTYDEWTPVAEWDGSGNLVATNVYGLGDDELLYRLEGTTQLFYKSDPRGNVMFLLDGNGNGVEKYKYDAFGSATITDWNGNARAMSAYGNRFMFGSREYIGTIGLYDMRNRVYDPSMGRFYQTDPIGFAGDSWNLYRFCGNNPLLGGDPSGLDGLDTGFDLSADAFPSSGDFSDLSSDYDDSLVDGVDPAFGESLSIDNDMESSYQTAGSDNPHDYIDVSDFSGEPSSSSTVTESTTLDTSSTSFSAVASTSNEVQGTTASAAESATQSSSDFLRTIGLLHDFGEIGNKSVTGRAEHLQKLGKFVLNGREYKYGFSGYGSAGSSALAVRAAKIRQAKLATIGKNLSRSGTAIGAILAVVELNEHGFSHRQMVRTGFVWGGSYAALRAEPPFGAGIAIGIIVTDAMGGFDGLYSYFDDTPRFKLQDLLAPPKPTQPAGQ
jgi:RHS repeat-associated protein